MEREKARPQKSRVIFFAAATMALFGSCATYYESPLIDHDWVPTAFARPSLSGSSSNIGLNAQVFSAGGISSPSELGARLGLQGVSGGSFTETFGWNFGGSLNGFLIDTLIQSDASGNSENPAPYGAIAKNLLSFGGSAQLSGSIVLGDGYPFWFRFGPDLIYSFERGPYFDYRTRAAASSDASSPVFNVSPHGSVMDYHLTIEGIWRAKPTGYTIFGGGIGFIDPDFPAVTLDNKSTFDYGEDIYLAHQDRNLLFYAELNFGIGQSGVIPGLSAGLEIFLHSKEAVEQ